MQQNKTHISYTVDSLVGECRSGKVNLFCLKAPSDLCRLGDLSNKVYWCRDGTE